MLLVRGLRVCSSILIGVDDAVEPFQIVCCKLFGILWSVMGFIGLRRVCSQLVESGIGGTVALNRLPLPIAHPRKSLHSVQVTIMLLIQANCYISRNDC